MFEHFSLSTSWAGNKFENGEQLINKFKAMGFGKAELNYSVSQEMYEDLLCQVKTGKFEVTSVHHPFPKLWDEEYGTDSAMLGFLDETKRRVAIDMTKHSFDCAAQLGAKAVVIHLSEVLLEPEDHYDGQLKKLYKEGKRWTNAYSTCFQELQQHREQNHLYVEKCIESLKELAAYIEEKDYELVIGIENRAMSHQIPDFYEAEYILDKLEGLPIYFWYDLGHGVMMENLGLFNNKASLEKIISRTIGVHIHDVQGMRDHHAPYQLNDTIDSFIELFKKIPIQVLEIGAGIDEKYIIEGTKRLHEKMYG